MAEFGRVSYGHSDWRGRNRRLARSSEEREVPSARPHNLFLRRVPLLSRELLWRSPPPAILPGSSLKHVAHTFLFPISLRSTLSAGGGARSLSMLRRKHAQAVSHKGVSELDALNESGNKNPSKSLPGREFSLKNEHRPGYQNGAARSRSAQAP